MALFLDPSVPERFTPPGQDHLPEDKRVTYLLRVPRVADRVRLEREIAMQGGRQRGPLEMLGLLRRGVLEILDGDEHAAGREGLVARIDHAIDLQRQVGEAAQAAMAARGGDREGEALAQFQALAGEIAQESATLSDAMEMVRQVYQPLQQAIGDNAVYADIQGIAAAKVFVTGWEGLGKPCKVGPMGLEESSLAVIPPVHFALIGWHVRSLMAPTEDEGKKSVSPSPSPSARPSSTAKSTRPRKTPSKGTAGTSRKSASKN